MLDNIFIILGGAIFVIGIIAGIGPQNLNTLNHAIQKNYAWSVTTTCFLADTTLIIAGGIGLSLSDSNYIIFFINLVGLIFISIYIFFKIYRLFTKASKITFSPSKLSQRKSIIRALALTWLNPLVFMDTIVVIGGTAIQYVEEQRIYFIIGAVLGDFVWLFGMTLIGILFSHKLNNRKIWLSLDIMTIMIMLFILYQTTLFILNSKIISG